MSTGPTRQERLQIMLTAEVLRAVEDWRFRMRMPSRAAAVRALMRLGLSADGFEVADPQMRSGEFDALQEPIRWR